MKKILYIEPRNNDKRYLYYSYIGKELKSRNIELTIGNNLDCFNLNNYNLIILGYSVCSNNFATSKELLNTKTPIIAFLFKLSLKKDFKFNFLKKNNINVFAQQSRIPEFEKKYKIKINKILYSINNKLFNCKNLEKKYDLGMSGSIHDSKYYSEEAFFDNEKNLRQKIIDKLNNINIRKFINCSDINNKAYVEDINQYIDIINKTKFWICTSADHGDLTPRFCEIICCKTLIFCNEQKYDTYKDIFIDGETCVFFKNDLSDFENKIYYYLKHPDKCTQMVNKMYQIYMNNYSSSKIIDKFLTFCV